MGTGAGGTLFERPHVREEKRVSCDLYINKSKEGAQ